MKRNPITALCCAVIILLLGGCQLAREDAGRETYEDRLIGTFITTEYLDLFDFEGFLNEHLNSYSSGEIKMDGDTEKYQGRIYATLLTKALTNEETGEPIESQEYVFEDMEGFAYFAPRIPFATPDGDDYYTASSSDEAISDGRMDIKVDDEGTTTMLDGTLYVALSNQNRTFYMNPVYQSADGRVYLTSGTGISAPMNFEGATMSQSMDSSVTVTENGKTSTEGLSIKVSFNTMSVPERIALLEFDARSNLLSRTEYAADKMPEAISRKADTEYILVETRKRGISGEQLIVREIFGNDVQSIEYFVARADGICVKRTLKTD